MTGPARWSEQATATLRSLAHGNRVAGRLAALSQRTELPIFIRSGVLMLLQGPTPYADTSFAVTRRLGLETERLDGIALRARYPQVDWSGVAFAKLEPRFGALLARRAVQALVSNFVATGGAYLHAQVLPPVSDAPNLTRIVTTDGGAVEADVFVFACAPRLTKLFPDVLANRMFVTRHEVVFVGVPGGDRRFGAGQLPGWADFNGGDIIYGFPDIEGRGSKIASDRHGPVVDPEPFGRIATPSEVALLRNYISRRVPALAATPVTETRVCQYENSSNGDLMIDRHPRWQNVVLAGCGSGHGFNHGPAVGRLAAALAVEDAVPKTKFSLATKRDVQSRQVH